MTDRLDNLGIFLLAVASAFVTANAYYIHPIIGRVAESFEVSKGLVGVVPALNQFALALGVLLLLPLGDRMSNRRLVAVCLSAQTLALLCMAVVETFSVFVVASTVLGFFTITPYLLPAYASKRVEPANLGFVTAVLTAGVIAGVQLSRLGSGVIAEYLGWRVVYFVATALMTCSAVALPLLMKGEGPRDNQETLPSYGALLRSLARLSSKYRSVVISGVIQGLNFGIFIATWMGIGLHLTSERMNLGTDIVGYLAAFSGIAILFTPFAGRYADRLGPEKARVFAAWGQLLGISTFMLAGSTWWYLLLPIWLIALVSPVIDISGRIIGLRQPAEVRTRMMSLYITLMFVGGSIGSWSGTLAYDSAGWSGTVILICCMSAVVCLLSMQQYAVAVTRRRS
ncbi:MAG: MFS transporter [Pseudomonadota bacterium]